jgi:hypothetical protein
VQLHFTSHLVVILFNHIIHIISVYLSNTVEGEEDDPAASINSVNVELEDEMDDADVEDDEEELDIDICLAAAIEDKPMVGLRRSARLGAMSDELRSLRVAQLLQEQTEEEAVYLT